MVSETTEEILLHSYLRFIILFCGCILFYGWNKVPNNGDDPRWSAESTLRK